MSNDEDEAENGELAGEEEGGSDEVIECTSVLLAENFLRNMAKIEDDVRSGGCGECEGGLGGSSESDLCREGEIAIGWPAGTAG